MRAIVIALVAAVSLPVAAGPAKVKVTLAFTPLKFKGVMEVYEVAPGKKPKLWETKTVKNFAEVPAGEKLEGGVVEIRAGSVERMILVMRNDTKKPIYFFAAPHVVEPIERSLGFKFKCLCINHAFGIPPEQIWYRVVELRMQKGFVGDEMQITHSLIPLPPERAKEFELEKGQ